MLRQSRRCGETARPRRHSPETTTACSEPRGTLGMSPRPTVVPGSNSVARRKRSRRRHDHARQGPRRRLATEAREAGFAAALAARLKRSGETATLAVVHDYSTHNLLLRYWLASAGAVADRDYDLCVTPPARTVEALRSRRIVGFCAGAPWGEIAERAGVGLTVATSNDVWRNAPEKALAVRERWSEENPQALAQSCARFIAPRGFATPPPTLPISRLCSRAAPGSTSTVMRFFRRCRERSADEPRRVSIPTRRPTPGVRTPCGSSIK